MGVRYAGVFSCMYQLCHFVVCVNSREYYVVIINWECSIHVPIFSVIYSIHSRTYHWKIPDGITII